MKMLNVKGSYSKGQRPLLGEEMRYSRQATLPGLGSLDQGRLSRSSVFLVGCGALASSAAYYLVAAGVGRIGIADDDRVEIHNLNRQILHNAERLGVAKVESARQTLQAFHPAVAIETYASRLSSVEDVSTVTAGYDLILDCTDNYPSRYLINDTCLQTGKPWIYGSVCGFEGQAMTIVPGKGPCYRCLYPSAPAQSPPVESVIGVSPGLIGIIQAAEAIKYLLGVGSLLSGRLLFADLLDMSISEFNVSPKKDCPSCGQEKSCPPLVSCQG